MKRGTWVLAMVLLSASAMQPSFAGTHHPHHGATRSGTAHSPDGKAKKPDKAEAKDSSDEINAPSRMGGTGDKEHSPAANAKSAVPFQVRRFVVPAPAETRNSIGVVVTPPKSATIGTEEPKPAVPVPISIPARSADLGVLVRPVTMAKIPEHGKIDGAGMIRPSVAPTGLGGPAKSLAGINGTTFREKR